jgi:ATP-dependent 26S proteasome regulatory subunit
MANASSPPAPASGRALAALEQLVAARHPLIYVHSAEEVRVRALLEEIARKLWAGSAGVWSWSATDGLRRPDGSPVGQAPIGPRAVLDYIASHPGPAIFHLKDFHEYLRDAPDVRRRLRDLYELCLDSARFVVITSPVEALPEELSQHVALLELHHPDLDELLALVRREGALLAGQGCAVDSSEATAFKVARTLQGLTLDQARHALRRAVSVGTGITSAALPHLLEEKKLVVNKSGLVQYVADGTQIEHVGGLEFLKKWLLERRKLFLERDSLAAEIVPKGVLVMGVSGCGKSLSVKAIAECFSLPLYRIDMIEVFSGRHGNPDRAFVEACRIVEAVAPAVVWFDEIEMGLTAQTGEATNDLGRIFAFFLTWMQEKARGLFVAATANRIDLLPAEMIRKGRFDEVFFIDLPGEEERSEIFRIHLAKRGVDPEVLEVGRLKKLTAGWTGAEVEQCVVSALTVARLQDRAPTFADLLAVAQNVIPLSKTMREQVDHIRSWAFNRAVRASPREPSRQA